MSNESPQIRCPRCRMKFPPEELLPVPRWQAVPGEPKVLRVPGFNPGGREGGCSNTVPGETYRHLCRDCCIRTIQLKRFPRLTIRTA